MSKPNLLPSTRRDFLKSTSGAVLAGAWAAQAGLPTIARGAPDSRKLKIGVVGEDRVVHEAFLGQDEQD